MSFPLQASYTCPNSFQMNLSRGVRRNAAQPNRKFRVRVTPAKRGRGRKRRQPPGENWLDKTPAERHASMAGFCSCKTDIGKNLDAAAQASFFISTSRLLIERSVPIAAVHL
jgi:hypothetical protein